MRIHIGLNILMDYQSITPRNMGKLKQNSLSYLNSSTCIKQQ